MSPLPPCCCQCFPEQWEAMGTMGTMEAMAHARRLPGSLWGAGRGFPPTPDALRAALRRTGCRGAQ